MNRNSILINDKEIQQFEEYDNLNKEQQKMVKYNKFKSTNKKKQRRQRVIVIPLSILYKNILKSDCNPIVIYNFKKLMKSYENEQYNKFRTFGIQDAGIASISEIKLDKINQNLQISICTHSQGTKDFYHLIELYKSYQDQEHYELAKVLEEYQEWTFKSSYSLYQSLQNLQEKQTIVQEQIDQTHPIFEQDTLKWAEANLKNELYELILGTINIDEKRPILKKKIFSKEFVMLIGGDLETVYQKLDVQNMKENFSCSINGGEFDGKVQLKKVIKQIQSSMNGDKYIQYEDQIITFEGIVIPTIKTIFTLYYDHKERVFYEHYSNKNYNQFNFVKISKYNFHPNWIKYLIEIRSQSNLSVTQLKGNNQNNFLNRKLDIVCQQEYFLEKFYYT